MKANVHYLAAAMLGATLVLPGCEEKSATPTPAAEVTAPVVEDTMAPAVVTPQIKGEVLTFAGATSDVITLDPSWALYQVSFEMTSETDQPKDKYDDTSPAMPLITSGGLSVYLHSDGYRFSIGNDDQILAGQPDKITSVTLVNSLEGSVLVVDGKTVGTGPRLKPLSSITVGKGFKERYWKGSISKPAYCRTPEGKSLDELAATPEALGCDL